MRSAYIVSYDLASAGTNYERVLEKIKANPGWARLGGSAYVVISDRSPAEIRDEIKSAMNAKDKLYVGIIGAPAAWVGMTDDVSEWLKKNLKSLRGE